MAIGKCDSFTKLKVFQYCLSIAPEKFNCFDLSKQTDTKTNSLL